VFLRQTLEALTDQTEANFEVVIVLKPSSDGSEQVIHEFNSRLDIQVIIQKEGFIVDSINLGLKYTKGDVVIFLDDDAIPDEYFVEEHLKCYNSKLKIGGVAGNVIPTILGKGGELNFKSGVSQIISDRVPFLNSVSRKLWRCPLPGMENYYVYISEAGNVEYNAKVAKNLGDGLCMSLLGMGANMSVLREAIEGLTLPRSWILGLSYEQYIGWFIWHLGYITLFDPKAIVHHLIHGESLSQNVSGKRLILRSVESQLLFSRLYGLEPRLSMKKRVIWLIFDFIKILRKKSSIRTRLLAFIKSEIIGLKWRLIHWYRENGIIDLLKIIES